MSGRVRSWVAGGVLVFVGQAVCRPAVAADATGDEPTVTPYGKGSEAPAASAPPAAPAPTQPAAVGHAALPAPAPPAGNAASAAPPYPPPPPYPYGRYPPPGYAPYPYPYPYPPYPGYPPPQLTKVHRPRRGLVASGAITFGVSWSIAAFISLAAEGCTDCAGGVNYLWVPIAGPLFLSKDNSDGTPILVLWSLAQATGVAMFAVGLAGHDVMEYRWADRGPTFQLGPLIARDASGMTLTARW